MYSKILRIMLRVTSPQKRINLSAALNDPPNGLIPDYLPRYYTYVDIFVILGKEYSYLPMFVFQYLYALKKIEREKQGGVFVREVCQATYIHHQKNYSYQLQLWITSILRRLSKV
jgi:hypothetical protein